MRDIYMGVEVSIIFLSFSLGFLVTLKSLLAFEDVEVFLLGRSISMVSSSAVERSSAMTVSAAIAGRI